MRRIVVAGLALSAALLPAELAPQSIRGRVLERATDRPVPFAYVAHLSKGGALVATVLAAENGSFLVTAPASGRFLVYADRPGFRSATEGPVQMRRGEADVEAMEIYRGAAEFPAQFGGAESGCGVIVIWTRR